MDAQRWNEIQRIYEEARERDPSDREAFLESACGGDDALCREVRSLLAFNDQAGEFMEAPALDFQAREIARMRGRLAGRSLGPYELVALLGAGGMGEVYKARDTRLHRSVAIKVLPAHLADDPQSLRRFEKEARAVAAISHPGILAIHDFGSDDGIQFAVMELLEGETLRDSLQSGMSWQRAVDIAAEVADALWAAHSKNIIPGHQARKHLRSP